MRITGSPLTRKRAWTLRKQMSAPERLLWSALRRDQLGRRFRRSHPAEPYVLDFYCCSARLCVEVDGSQHDYRSAHDARRNAHLANLGIRTLRFAASDVLANLAGVVATISDALDAPSAPPGHLPQVPGGGTD